MKNLLLLLFTLYSLAAYSQPYIGTQGNYGKTYFRVEVDSSLIVPLLTDTLPHTNIPNLGAIYLYATGGDTIPVIKSHKNYMSLIATRDYVTANSMSNSLLSGRVWIGNSSNVATAVAVSGAFTLSNTGVATLATVNSNATRVGSSTYVPRLTFDAYGRVTTVDSILAAITASNVATFSNKRYTPRVNTDSATYTTSITMNFDSYDTYVISAQAGNLLFNAPSGTPADMETREVVIRDNNVVRTLTFNAIYNYVTTTMPLPTVTVQNKFTVLQFQWWTINMKWNLTGKLEGLP